MMKRKIYSELLKWKDSKHKSLIISGQRQVGKTYIIDCFGRAEYTSYVKIDFSTDPSSKSIFSEEAGIDTILDRISVRYGPIDTNDRTLIFIDEIQECPVAYGKLKQFTMDGRCDVIASGSLLGIQYLRPEERTEHIHDPLSPMGYIDEMELRSMDFEEFLWAIGLPEKIVDEVRTSIKARTPIDSYILSELKRSFKDYMIVGGMPEAVDAFINNKEGYHAAGIIQENILSKIGRDINRYNSGQDKLRVTECFSSIPDQLRNTNRKFMFSRINGEGSRRSSDRYMGNLLWIKNAGYCNYCYGLTQPRMPLATNRIPDSFRIYMSDTGLLMSMLGRASKSALFNDDVSFDGGAVTENEIMECLTKCGYRPYYYRHDKNPGMMELDFVLETYDGITVIEVKSGKTRNAPSLRKVTDFFKISRRIMFEDTNIFTDDEGVEHYPLFAAAFFDSIEGKPEGPLF